MVGACSHLERPKWRDDLQCSRGNVNVCDTQVVQDCPSLLWCQWDGGGLPSARMSAFQAVIRAARRAVAAVRLSSAVRLERSDGHIRTTSDDAVTGGAIGPPQWPKSSAQVVGLSHRPMSSTYVQVRPHHVYQRYMSVHDTRRMPRGGGRSPDRCCSLTRCLAYYFNIVRV